MNNKFFEWIAECCALLGKDKKYGALLIEDKNWGSAWLDGMTPSEAVAEFKETYPNGYPPEVEQNVV